jgi:SAM-dependent methyltransferase
LIEDACEILPPLVFDLVWAFGVLEHVWDLDGAVTALLKVLRPGGRLCLSVPMNEFRATGPLPEFSPTDPACHRGMAAGAVSGDPRAGRVRILLCRRDKILI